MWFLPNTHLVVIVQVNRHRWGRAWSQCAGTPARCLSSPFTLKFREGSVPVNGVNSERSRREVRMCRKLLKNLDEGPEESGSIQKNDMTTETLWRWLEIFIVERPRVSCPREGRFFIHLTTKVTVVARKQSQLSRIGRRTRVDVPKRITVTETKLIREITTWTTVLRIYLYRWTHPQQVPRKKLR